MRIEQENFSFKFKKSALSFTYNTANLTKSTFTFILLLLLRKKDQGLRFMDKETLENIYRHFRYRFLKLNILPAFLGLLLLCSPNTLNYTQVDVIFSDRLCSCLLIFLAIASLTKRSLLWLGAPLGIWVTLFACVAGRSPTIFANDTLIGFAILAVVCISPTRPEALEVGPTLPEGFSYNPSAGGRRAAVLFLSLLGWLEARYLTASSLGITSSQSSNFLLLYSSIMTVYSLLVVLSLAGSERRWHTRPKIVIATALALTGVIILTLLPIILHQLRYDCWLCLCLTIEPALAVVFAYDETRATLRYISQFLGDKRALTRASFFGSEYYKHTLSWEERTVLPLRKAYKQAFEGISFPINQLLAILVATVFVKVNSSMGLPTFPRNFLNICCWFIIVLFILAFAESLRHLRWMNLIFSAAILFSPVLFHIPVESPMFLPIIVTGLILIILSIGKRRRTKRKL
ncbi:hypothetical protein CpB0235 [Chlamydia pneumoniae TW-183]|uniref:Uncharacterized protein n=4 Tax=Chlamydia pneumoniae TaxID=83558 RepID=A0A0F7XEJ6_CHLPN|nr:hypothetical protein CpB0235 [Chlamydia pneumoniae TW-183]CRI32728.1 Uncharacterized protein BN1224_Wien1_A_02350 [Chlamydia pneumoniae]CRI35591.1 Uncharacterized protein BN1224_CM1_A_02380 [Chlamydia pneumoniae]CRI36717.1 Uncharacterized protein BN1224_CV14_A_02360 [Chlamydia pneumoniae]CRI37841.1 Uncharacterized protein BN1224_CV15_B_01640 [Chlamydia pneumoniae]